MKYVVTIVAALIWVPIFAHFFQAWRRRKNPISLAICGIVVSVVHDVVMRPFERDVDPDVVFWTALVARVAAALFFYAACRRARARFSSDRRIDVNQSDGY